MIAVIAQMDHNACARMFYDLFQPTKDAYGTIYLYSSKDLRYWQRAFLTPTYKY